ncbi:MAG: hypothetical protein QOF76_1771 [Solirubrobacteraceae bacterium]|nr:hypothetical protein [Solirubrobacteraceae bacterium]
MKRVLQLVATLLALLVPAAAHGATITVRPNPDAVDPADPTATPYADEVYVAAEPGETNHVTVAYAGNAETVTVTDSTATFTSTGTCTAVDAHTATCAARPEALSSFLQDTRVELGDGDDTVVSTRPEPGPPIGGLHAFGGPGDDILTGSPTTDILDGGTGADTISGGAGSDEITDGDGEGTTDADTLGGGAGDGDTLSYASHTTAVTVDLAATTAGSDTENDTVAGFESATGGAGDDTLTGTATSANTLKGGPGNDTISGLGGSSPTDSTDVLDGGKGADVLTGGREPEAFHGGLGHDVVHCGGSPDLVYDPTDDELLGRGCETVRFTLAEADSFSVPTYPKAVSATGLRFAFACPRLDALDGEPSSCTGKLVLRRVGNQPQKLGAGKIANAGTSDEFPVNVHVKRRFGRLARRADGVVAAVNVKPGDNLPRVGWRIKLNL